MIPPEVLEHRRAVLTEAHRKTLSDAAKHSATEWHTAVKRLGSDPTLSTVQAVAEKHWKETASVLVDKRFLVAGKNYFLGQFWTKVVELTTE
jgi:hypothetical protein